jgi:hypothetical protein
LFEKAKVMTGTMKSLSFVHVSPGQKPFWTLKRLNFLRRWEMRPLLVLFPTGIAAIFVDRSIGLVVIGLGAVVTIVFDSLFNIAVTALFLSPILVMLKTGPKKTRQGRQLSPAASRLEYTKHMTLAGTAVAVISNSLFYLNFIFYVLFQDAAGPSPFLMPKVFGACVDSVLSDLGIIMVCGVLKKGLGGKIVHSILAAVPRSSAMHDNTAQTPHLASACGISVVPAVSEFEMPSPH